jgi:hypothetical protein
MRRISLLVVIALCSSFCAPRSAPRATASDPSAVDIAQLWIDPVDLESRDLYHGPGGAALAPDPAARFALVARDTQGYSPGYDVRDIRGVQWSVKVGIEAQPEVAVSRALWAIGYHQPPTYLLTDWTIDGVKAPAGAARFRRDSEDQKVVDEWSWYENPFVGTRAFKGLVVANVLFNNWDWKTSNNKIYSVGDGDGATARRYVVRDLGASLGKTSFPSFLRLTPFRLSQGSRNDIEDFEQQGFIKGRDGQRVTLDYGGTNTPLLDALTVSDVAWTCALLARISDRQWHDAFRAAGYTSDYHTRYTAKVKAKISEGLALAAAPQS